MEESGKTRREICEALGFSYFTFTSWVNGSKYPRMDKVEMLAEYFGILKSDLIEDKSSEEKEKAPGEELTEGEKALIELFRRVPAESQQLVLGMIRAALNTDK
jgi:transcriptional regulator with XRE-family HTH domain